MNIIYAARAQVDLEHIAEYGRQTFGTRVAVALGTYFRAMVARIRVMPESGEAVPERAGVRVVPLVRYPFRIFYTVANDTVTILHILHTSRRPWNRDEQ